MTSSPAVQSYRQLRAEQRLVQETMTQARSLSLYEGSLLPGQDWPKPCSSAVRDFCAPLAVGEAGSLPSLLLGLAQASPDGKADWVDMGGGYGLATRQAALLPELAGRVRTTKVDLEDIRTRDLSPRDRQELEQMQPAGITSRRAKPATILADATTVTLRRPANLITAVELAQYLDDPLKAICNWYNQLADNGLLLVATGLHRAYGTAYPKEYRQTRAEASPNKDFFRQLGRFGIRHDFTLDQDETDGSRPASGPDDYRVLVIQKQPGTQLRIVSPVTKITVSRLHKGHKVVTYEPPTNLRPIVEVTSP